MNNKLVLVLVLIGFSGLFIFQNMAVVKIQFLFWSIEMSRSLMMIVLLALGITIGWFLHAYMRHHKS